MTFLIDFWVVKNCSMTSCNLMVRGWWLVICFAFVNLVLWTSVWLRSSVQCEVWCGTDNICCCSFRLGLVYIYIYIYCLLLCCVSILSERARWVVWVWWESLTFLSEWVQSQSSIKYFSLSTLVNLFCRMVRLHVGCLAVRGWLGWLQCWGLCLLKYWIWRFCYCVFCSIYYFFL